MSTVSELSRPPTIAVVFGPMTNAPTRITDTFSSSLAVTHP